MTIKVELSYGEMLDKITILQIKRERMTDKAKVSNVEKELSLLTALWQADKNSNIDIEQEIVELKSINEALWDIEDDIRDKEKAKEFDVNFIELARSVYVTNDKRAAVKRVINVKLGSDLIEEKSYSDYL
ncbi:MAG: DUF6165 family protein [Woeseiaceae bacterium]